MKRMIPLALTMVLWSWGAPCPAQSDSSGVRDHAKMFSPDTVRQSEETLRSVRRESGWQVVIETVESLEGKGPAERALANAKALNVHGLYVLIAKKEHQVAVEPSRSAEPAFPKAKDGELRDKLVAEFKAKHYDQGLLDLVSGAQKLATAHPDPGRREDGLGTRRGPVSSGVRDGAKMFSPEAVQEGRPRPSKRLQKKGPWQVVIETVETLDGQSIQQRAQANAQALNVHGLYLLIDKSEHKFQFEPSR